MIKVVSNQEQTKTGALPLSFKSKGEALTGYKLYGTADGAGVETESGEPTGYKLPMTVESGEQSQDIPIYIGASKLGEEEYVDFGEQKVYRFYGELLLKGDEKNLQYYGEYQGVQAFYIELPDNYQLLNFDSTPYLSCNYYSATYMVEPAENKTCRYRQVQNGGALWWNTGRIYVFDNDYTNLSDYRAHLTELYNANTPLKIRYLLKDAPIPTNPPVPLPEISTYSGENTLSCSEETLGDESQITYVGPVEETITKIMRTEDDGQGNVTEHVLYREGS